MPKHSIRPETEAPPAPLRREWEGHRTSYLVVTGVGGEGGGFSDLGGYTDGLDLELLEDAPWSMR
jgi:hypothetical protein